MFGAQTEPETLVIEEHSYAMVATADPPISTNYKKDENMSENSGGMKRNENYLVIVCAAYLLFF